MSNVHVKTSLCRPIGRGTLLLDQSLHKIAGASPSEHHIDEKDEHESYMVRLSYVRFNIQGQPHAITVQLREPNNVATVNRSTTPQTKELASSPGSSSFLVCTREKESRVSNAA